MENIILLIQEKIVTYGPKFLLAIIVLIVGRKLTNLAQKVADAGLRKAKIEKSLRIFIESLINVAFKIILLITVAGMIGIETTSFVAMLGAVSFAIGLALQGSLANFAGGVLILLFKPYKAGDIIHAQDITGQVEVISVFTTIIITPDNKTAIIPNGKMADDNIINYSKQGTIRLDIPIGVSYDADLKNTKQVIQKIVSQHPHVLPKPAPSIIVNELADSSVNLLVRPFVKPAHYRSTGPDLTEQIKGALDQANIEIPYPHRVVQLHTIT